MEKREDNWLRNSRRKYEKEHFEERKNASGIYATKLPRAELDEINSFLKEHHLSKVELIRAGYVALLEVYNAIPKG